MSRNDDTQWRVRRLAAKKIEIPPDPAVRGIEGRQRDTCHRRREGKRQIDETIQQLFARKPIAHQHPGHQETEDRIEQRTKQ